MQETKKQLNSAPIPKGSVSGLLSLQGSRVEVAYQLRQIADGLTGGQFPYRNKAKSLKQAVNGLTAVKLE